MRQFEKMTYKGTIDSRDRLDDIISESHEGDIYVQNNYLGIDNQRYDVEWVFEQGHWHILSKLRKVEPIRYVCEQCSKKCIINIYDNDGNTPEICPFPDNKQKAQWEEMRQ